MATMVGTQKELSKMLDALLELDFDAIEAYRAAIERIDNADDGERLRAFMADHERHTVDLRPLIVELGKEPAEGADLKQWLTKGKVVIASLAGDKAILLAMKTNEEDTNTAYERAISRRDLPAHVRTVLERNLADERRHRAWIEGRLSAQTTAEAR